MPKSIIEQKIESFLVHVDRIDSNNADLRIRIYSAIQESLKEAEKRIDKIECLFVCEVHNQALDLCGMKKLKQILNDCFGVGK